MCSLIFALNIVFLTFYINYLSPQENVIMTPAYIKSKMTTATIAISLSMIVYMYFNRVTYSVFDDVESLNAKIENNAKEKEAFFATISHEIRNPLQSLIGSIELLQDKDMERKTFSTLIEICKNCGETVLNLVNNVLDISKIAANKMTLCPAPSDLREIINKILRISQAKATAKNIDLLLKDDISLPPCLMIDSQRMSQIVLNLVSNAIKFTSKGMVIVKLNWIPLNEGDKKENKISQCLKFSSWKEEIMLAEKNKENISLSQTVYCQELIASRKKNFKIEPNTTLANTNARVERRGIVKIEIMDSGIGINKESVKKLFQPYQQANTSISK